MSIVFVSLFIHDYA